MKLEVSETTGRLVQQELQNGRFESVDEIIATGIHARLDDPHRQQAADQQRHAVETALHFARHKAIPLGDSSIKDLIHEGHRL